MVEAIKLDKPIKVGAREGRAIDAVNDHAVLAMEFIVGDERVYKVDAWTADHGTTLSSRPSAFTQSGFS